MSAKAFFCCETIEYDDDAAIASRLSLARLMACITVLPMPRQKKGDTSCGIRESILGNREKNQGVNLLASALCACWASSTPQPTFSISSLM